MPVVKIPTPLRKFTDGRAEVEVGGSNVREVFDDLVGRHGDLQSKILDDSGEVRRFINVYVNDEDVRHQDGLATPVGAQDVVSVVPAIAGGSG